MRTGLPLAALPQETAPSHTGSNGALHGYASTEQEPSAPGDALLSCSRGLRERHSAGIFHFTLKVAKNYKVT